MKRVILDKNLRWRKQVDNIAKKVKKGLGVLRKIRDFDVFNLLAHN